MVPQAEMCSQGKMLTAIEEHRRLSRETVTRHIMSKQAQPPYCVVSEENSIYNGVDPMRTLSVAFE